MDRRSSSSSSGAGRKGSGAQEQVPNIRTRPPHFYDNITRQLIKLGATLGVTALVGLLVRYGVQEFDPAAGTIMVTTSRVDNRDIASLSVSKHFLERILEFVEESLGITATIVSLGFPVCTLLNRYFAKMRARAAASPSGGAAGKLEILDERIITATIPKFVIIGDAQACLIPETDRLRPLVRDTIYQMIKTHLKPKLIVEDSFEDATKLGIRIGLIGRQHHRLAVLKSVDLMKRVTDSRGDIKPEKVRHLLARMKILSQATPADKPLLLYLIKHCHSQANESLLYLGQSFTDPEAMRLADCALAYADCDDDDVKKEAQVLLSSSSRTLSDLHLFAAICLLASNISQSYALYQVAASISSCLFRFISISVFQEQLLSHSQFSLILICHQLLVIMALMTKWLSSLPANPLRGDPSQLAPDSEPAVEPGRRSRSHSALGEDRKQSQRLHLDDTERHQDDDDDTLDSASLNSSVELDGDNAQAHTNLEGSEQPEATRQSRRSSRAHSRQRRPKTGQRGSIRPISAQSRRQWDDENQQTDFDEQHNEVRMQRLSGIDLDKALIDSASVRPYRQTFTGSRPIDDATYRLVKLHVAYQLLVMLIIMVFGNSMFQLNLNGSRQHQTLALNSLVLNNLFNSINCFNQLGHFDLKSALRSHPFFVCVLLLAVFLQVLLSELNAFGLENLSPIQWFVCFVFGLLSALIAPLTGQQQQLARSSGSSAATQNKIEPSTSGMEMDGRYHQPALSSLSRSPAATRVRSGASSSAGSPSRSKSSGRHSRRSHPRAGSRPAI